jgi:hypothetical protein
VQLVLAVADEREVVVVDPLDQRPGFGELVRIDGRRTLVELRDDRANVPADLRPGLDRGEHVREHAVQLGVELVEEGLIGLPVDLDVQQRLGRSLGCPRQEFLQSPLSVAPDPDDRMDGQMDGAPTAGERHRHGIDEERHVVRDDLDNAVRRLPAVFVDPRCAHVHLRLARPPSLQEVPVRERRTVEVEFGEILRGGVGVVRTHEPLDLGRLRFRQPLSDMGDRLLDERRPRVLRLDGHPSPSPFSPETV